MTKYLKFHFLFLSLILLTCTSAPSDKSGSDIDDVSILPIDTNFPPIVSELRTELDEESTSIDIIFDISDSEDEVFEVCVHIIKEDGTSYQIPSEYLEGDTGIAVTKGSNKQIKWAYGNDPVFEDLINNPFRVEVEVNDNFVEGLSDVIALVQKSYIRNDIQNLEGVRHYNANPQNLEKARNYIRAQFHNYNIDPKDQVFSARGTNGVNIIGTIEGQVSSDSFYIIDGHYDTITSTPGADDNTSGTVGMLEAMRVLSQFNFKKGIKFIAFDMEELGLIGSRYYANSKPVNEYIEGMINFEMIGYTCRGEPECRDFPNADTSIYNISSSFSDSLSNEFRSVGAQYVPQLKILSTSDNGDPNFRRSDHAPFWDIGVDALFITDGANFRTPHYHQPTDKLETLDLEFATNIVKTAVGTIARLAGYSHSGRAISSVIYLD